MGPGARRVVPRAGKHLDVETEHAFGLPDEVGERQPGEQPEALHRRVETPQPLTGDVAEVLTVAPTPGRLGQFADRLDEAHLVPRVLR